MLWLLLWHLSYLFNNNLTFCCDNLIVLWSENIPLYFSNSVKHFRNFFLAWLAFINIPCALEMIMYSMGFKSSWLNIEIFYVFCDFLAWILSIAETDAWICLNMIVNFFCFSLISVKNTALCIWDYIISCIHM